LIALAAGLAQARATAQAQSFREGGLYSPKGGFTGYGPPDGQSMAVGAKPYNYHKQEYIMPSNVTMLGNNKEWLSKIHKNKIDIGKMMSEKSHTVNINSQMTTDEIVRVLRDLPNQMPATTINFDKSAIVKVVEESREKRRKLKVRL
jgi:hypothetical protein